jgi:hypothetical protein
MIISLNPILMPLRRAETRPEVRPRSPPEKLKKQERDKSLIGTCQEPCAERFWWNSGCDPCKPTCLSRFRLDRLPYGRGSDGRGQECGRADNGTHIKNRTRISRRIRRDSELQREADDQNEYGDNRSFSAVRF